MLNKAPKVGFFPAISRRLVYGIAHGVRRAGTAVAAGLTWARDFRALLALNEGDRRQRRSRPTQPVPVNATVPERGFVPGSRRHELSSLQGPHALAPDEVGIGEELVDPEAIEVPVGNSSDSEYGARLSKSKLPQPATTGAALMGEPEVIGEAQVIENPLMRRHKEITARPSERPAMDDDAYDAVSPENVGLEWLCRATQAGAVDGVGSQESLDGFMNEAAELDGIATSEASLRASMPLDAMLDDDEREDYDAYAAEDPWGRPDPDAAEVARTEHVR